MKKSFLNSLTAGSVAIVTVMSGTVACADASTAASAAGRGAVASAQVKAAWGPIAASASFVDVAGGDAKAGGPVASTAGTVAGAGAGDATAGAAGAGSVAPRPGVAGLMVPYIAPQDCEAGVSVPVGGQAPLFSKDCNYVFVLPRTEGRVSVSAYAPSANLQKCGQVEMDHTAADQLRAIRQTVYDAISKAIAVNPADPRIQALRDNAKYFNDEIAKLQTSYALVEGGQASLLFDASVSEDEMNQWRNLNHQMIEAQHTVFVPAPIAEGFISFGLVKASKDDLDSDPIVLQTVMPGLNKTGDTATISMNSGVSGAVKLSMTGACEMAKITKTDENGLPLKRDYSQLDVNQVAALLPANVTYSVDVQTGVGYSVQVMWQNFINAFQEQSKQSGQFSLNDLLKTDLEGTTKEVCHVDVDRYPGATTLTEQGFDKQFTADICKSMIARLMGRLETEGFINTVKRESGDSPATVAGGNVPETHNSESCLSFGPFSHCKNSSYTILHWIDGVTDKTTILHDGTENYEQETGSYSDFMKRWTTMGFVGVSQKATN